MEAKTFISVMWPTCLMTVSSCKTVEKVPIFSFTWQQNVLKRTKSVFMSVICVVGWFCQGNLQPMLYAMPNVSFRYIYRNNPVLCSGYMKVCICVIT